jgi:HAD superfamily hydrolase (TIGR01509 family)
MVVDLVGARWLTPGRWADQEQASDREHLREPNVVDMKRAAGYQAILFDVGGTLLDIVRDPHMTAVEAVAPLGDLSAAEFAAAIREVVGEWRAAGGLPELEDLPETWVGHNRRALTLTGFTGDIAAAAQIMEDVFLSEGLEVYPDVVVALQMLTGWGYKMGVVSNWPATLESTLQEVGLRKYFSSIVASGTVGYAKPHPSIFRIAMDRLGVDPHHALYVGDSVEHDVGGAQAAGMNVVLLDRVGRHEAHQPSISSLMQLLELLRPEATQPAVGVNR